MNLILVLDHSSQLILIFLQLSFCQDKYIVSTNSEYGQHQFKPEQLENNTIQFELSYSKFDSPPQILIGIIQFNWNQFKNNENEFSLDSQVISSISTKIYFTTTSSSSANLNYLVIKYFAFINDEIKVLPIKIDKNDIESMTSNGGSLGIRQKKIQFNHTLLKKPSTKRMIQCFIIGFRQEFSNVPQFEGDEKLSFFVESVGDFNENQFELTFTTLDQQNTLKWVKLNCIEFYQYDSIIQPKEFIQSFTENKYSYTNIQNTNSYLSDQSVFEIESQLKDISLTVDGLMYGFSGIDLQIYAKISILHNGYKIQPNQLIVYQVFGLVRSASSNLLFLKMKNCPKYCEKCVDVNVCQKCSFNFLLENGQCKSCKDNCKYCDSNQNCIGCLDLYFLYKGLCYQKQPKSTYCISRTINPF